MTRIIRSIFPVLLLNSEFINHPPRVTGNPASKTTLTLTGLPSHTSLDLDFVLAILESWDGEDGDHGPDHFNVSVDGNLVFSEFCRV